jgi:rhamnose utilization protein RhaD (predicted bifunctional aldolase and dehydrogenase)
LERSSQEIAGVTMNEFAALKDLSAKVGSEPLLVQAAGGNTSIKIDDVMWIKASGTWLKDATDKDIFVPLDFPELQRALARDDPACESCTDFVRADLNKHNLRPSIETSVHGLMSQKVVVHVHCVSTIAWAIRENAEGLLSSILEAFDWSWIPYARPGLQLSHAIRQNMKPGSNVLILGNHGLAVAADTVASCQRLLDSVAAALRLPARSVIDPDLGFLANIAQRTDYRLPHDLRCHAAALDGLASAMGVLNVYYPDHVVFLGTALPATLDTNAPAIAIPSRGVLINKTAKPAVEPMVRCLGDVFTRVPEYADLRALSAAQIDQLINWDAEKYRQNIKA